MKTWPLEKLEKLASKVPTYAGKPTAEEYLRPFAQRELARREKAGT